MRHEIRDGTQAALVLRVLRDHHPKGLGDGNTADLLRGWLREDRADLHPDGAIALDVAANDALLEVLPNSGIEGMELRDDVRQQERLLLGFLAVADGDGVIRGEMPAVIAGADVFRSGDARHGPRVAPEARRALAVDLGTREDAVGRPARARQPVVIAHGVAKVDQPLESDPVRRFAVRSRRQRGGRRGRHDVARHHDGAVGELIQGVHDGPRRGAVLADRVDRVEDALLDGDLGRALRQIIDQAQEAGRQEDKQADPAEEA